MPTLDTLTGLQFMIQHQDGASQQMLVDSDRVLIGSGAHCEIRLPGEHVASEHVLITFLGGAVYAQARALRPPPMINGAPFTETPIKPDSVLSIGHSAITISIVEIADKQEVIKKKQEPVRPLVWLLALVMVPLCVYVLLFMGPTDDVERPKTKDVPVLWSTEPATCQVTDPEQARNAALEKRIIAEGRRERSPFDLRDGVEAVPLFESASACLKVAGDAAGAKEMQNAADRLKARMDEEYRAHRVKLEHTLDVKDMKAAQREVKVLLEMLQGQTGEYITWLSNLDRKLRVTLGKDQKKP